MQGNAALTTKEDQVHQVHQGSLQLNKEHVSCQQASSLRAQVIVLLLPVMYSPVSTRAAISPAALTPDLRGKTPEPSEPTIH